ncbi:MAG: 5-(carboxyamino)imidazole ribonucleotide synthase [Woeseiaceae bacterium]|nr:5-(carboxyamino)imidazole ribonucleotide synthase [Woeseiaceae bacterium]
MKRLGVIGAGQLGQMLGIAAGRLGVAVTFLDPAADPPAAATGPVISCPFDNEAGLARLATCSDVISYEFENVPVDALAPLTARVPVLPPPDALRYAQDRWHEKQLFDALKIPVPRYARVDSADDLARAADTLGLPLVLKTRTLGYDGKGQFVIRSAAELGQAWQTLGPVALIAEQWIDFDCEVSLIGARAADGNIVTYALTENLHRDGMLRVSRAPSQNIALLDSARMYTRSLLEHLDYVGVLALEMFVAGDRLLANEFAPRVHNSGHWTIEGAVTSQFENHLRAIFGMPLGDTASIGCAGMLNLIGSMPDTDTLPRHFPWFLHDYGKSPRPGRKLGHLTVLADDPLTLNQRLAELEARLAI